MYKRQEYYQKGYDLLNNWLESNPNLELAQKRQALATLAELCSKMGEFDKGIELVKQVLGKSDALLTSKSEGENQKTSETAYSNEPMQSGKAWDDQVDLMLQTDMEMIQDNIDAGLIDEDVYKRQDFQPAYIEPEKKMQIFTIHIKEMGAIV